MVDVGEKKVSRRTAIAESCIRVSGETLDKIEEGKLKKGDPYAVARIAGIMGVKKTPDIIPMCHSITIDGVEISARVDRDKCLVFFEVSVSCSGKTGVEMEALTAVSIAALSFYDMCKSLDKGMVIENIRLLEKRGGKSGDWKSKNHI